MPAKKKPTTKGRLGKKSRRHDISKHIEQALASGTSVLVTCSDDPWLVSDREFFEANPSRSFRLRQVVPGELAAIPGEFAAVHHATHVIVKQIAPGQRSRQFFVSNIPDDAPGWDTLFALIWSAVIEGGPINLGDLARQALVIDHAAGKGGLQ